MREIYTRSNLVLLVLGWLQCGTTDNSGPTNETPMLLNTSRKGNLLAVLSTGWGSELQLGTVSLDGNNLCSGSGRTNVDHENFALGELGNLGLLAIGSLDTEETTEEEVVDLEVGVDGWEFATETEDETDETIGTAKSWINSGTNTCFNVRKSLLPVCETKTYQSIHQEQQTSSRCSRRTRRQLWSRLVYT